MTSESTDRPGLLREFMRRIDAGEFDSGDQFHRFVQKEVIPLLVAGTLNAADLEALSQHYAHHRLPDHWGVARSAPANNGARP